MKIRIVYTLADKTWSPRDIQVQVRMLQVLQVWMNTAAAPLNPLVETTLNWRGTTFPV